MTYSILFSANKVTVMPSVQQGQIQAKQNSDPTQYK